MPFRWAIDALSDGGSDGPPDGGSDGPSDGGSDGPSDRSQMPGVFLRTILDSETSQMAFQMALRWMI